MSDPKTLEYWDTKHPKVNQLYKGRPYPGETSRDLVWDVRRFVMDEDWAVRPAVTAECFDGSVWPLSRMSQDALAGRVQRWVVAGRWKKGPRANEPILTYAGDRQRFGVPDFWLFGNETLHHGWGDCEDGSLLIASVLTIFGVDVRRIRVACGMVDDPGTGTKGGHAYTCYCRETDNEWTVLDWCWHEDSQVPVPEKTLLRDKPSYGDVWFSFNNKQAWSHDDRTFEGRVRRG